jgi:hypothetical protein
MGDVMLAEAKQEILGRLRLNYTKAEKQNKRYARPTTPGAPGALGWESKLDSVPDGATLAALWASGKYNEFADAVAALQLELGSREKDLDGILGPGTWARVGGVGEAMAGIDNVVHPQSEALCYKASEERIKRGAKMATGREFQLPEGATKSAFETIIAVHPGRMLDIEERYRATGAAGALVYSGLGSFVQANGIWANGLLPGATIQVWESKAAYDLLIKGETSATGQKRRLRSDDADFSGTSYVFVRYDTENPERILVRHFGRLEWVTKSDWAVWVAANAGQAPTSAPPAH